MPSTASTSSHGPAPAPAPPPPDERMPLSSVPDLTKFFPPLIQDAICAEMNRGAEGAYYDEFEQLYWMYSGWDEVREDFERVWRPISTRCESTGACATLPEAAAIWNCGRKLRAGRLICCLERRKSVCVDRVRLVRPLNRCKCSVYADQD
ncbi:hypothetical protein BJY59DRAFT_690238 [Rhodotorula toruloides]